MMTRTYCVFVRSSPEDVSYLEYIYIQEEEKRKTPHELGKTGNVSHTRHEYKKNQVNQVSLPNNMVYSKFHLIVFVHLMLRYP